MLRAWELRLCIPTAPHGAAATASASFPSSLQLHLWQLRSLSLFKPSNLLCCRSWERACCVCAQTHHWPPGQGSSPTAALAQLCQTEVAPQGQLCLDALRRGVTGHRRRPPWTVCQHRAWLAHDRLLQPLSPTAPLRVIYTSLPAAQKTVESQGARFAGLCTDGKPEALKRQAP